MEPSKRPLSPFNLFQRFKRSKILVAHENGDDSKETINRLITAVPGLEEVTDMATRSLSSEDIKNIRRNQIRSALLRNVSPKDISKRNFLDMNKMMSASWKAIDDFASSVFEELAAEGRNVKANTAFAVGVTPTLSQPSKTDNGGVIKPITPHLVRDDFTPLMKIDQNSAGNNGKDGPVEDFEMKVQEVTFPRQLMDVIEHQTKEGATFNGERVLEWLPSGDAFIIRDKNVFEKEVLPRHFSAKCKFMSFVRKLYRWGFRQLEKDARGILIFTHTHFIRGDKQLCLKMRSIVKKPPAQQALPPALAGLSPTKNVPQACGLTNQHYPTGPNTMRYSMAEHQFPARQMYPFPNRRGGEGIMISDGIGLRGPPSLVTPRQFSPRTMGVTSTDKGIMSSDGIGLRGPPSLITPRQLSPSTMGMTSTDMFEAALRLERLEQGQQRKMRLADMVRDRNVSAASSFNLPTMPSLDPSYGNSKCGKMSNVELAFEMMQRDPSMEPMHALEMAKRLNNKY